MWVCNRRCGGGLQPRQCHPDVLPIFTALHAPHRLAWREAVLLRLHPATVVASTITIEIRGGIEIRGITVHNPPCRAFRCTRAVLVEVQVIVIRGLVVRRAIMCLPHVVELLTLQGILLGTVREGSSDDHGRVPIPINCHGVVPIVVEGQSGFIPAQSTPHLPGSNQGNVQWVVPVQAGMVVASLILVQIGLQIWVGHAVINDPPCFAIVSPIAIHIVVQVLFSLCSLEIAGADGGLALLDEGKAVQEILVEACSTQLQLHHRRGRGDR
mmetsp:Transcript_29177/g.62035  ORF Transcript_29177/g.62035 Transcript_29177/m.62035 type:complete len:269 (+) Transcript_29177:181-987(+)